MSGKAVFLSIFPMIFAGCASLSGETDDDAPAPAAPVKLAWPPLPDDSFSRSGGTIRVVGLGRPDPSLTNETQRRSVSRDAAIVDARARLSAYLSGMLPPGKKLDAAISTVEITDTHWKPDGTANATLRVRESTVRDALESR